MTASLTADISALLGAQQPRIRQVPDYVSSSGSEAIDLAKLAGLELDQWEQHVLTDSLGERADGKWAAFEVGTVVPRQNGKGTILEARELAGLFLLGEKLLIHSAHEQATSSEHFRRLLSLIEGVPDFSRRVKAAPRGKGAEAIELHSGQRILFKTRTGGGGRGLTGDFVALDEAMILPVATTAALVPTMAARSVVGNPQLWYAGSAVDQDKHEHGIVLARLRERALAGKPKVAYFEWSAEGDHPDLVPESVLDDPDVWAQANPGLGIRISAEHIENERAGALGPREFAVERLGVGDWPQTDGGVKPRIDPEAWKALNDPRSAAEDPVAFSYDVTPDRARTAIGVCGNRRDGFRHVEIVEHKRGTDWVVDRLVGLVEKHNASGIATDAKGPGASLVSALREALRDTDVKVETVNAQEHAEACGLLYDAVDQKVLRHLGTQELALAVAGAVERPLGDSWAWSRKSSSVDISPLVACTLALWGLETATPERSNEAVFF